MLTASCTKPPSVFFETTKGLFGLLGWSVVYLDLLRTIQQSFTGWLWNCHGVFGCSLVCTWCSSAHSCALGVRASIFLSHYNSLRWPRTWPFASQIRWHSGSLFQSATPIEIFFGDPNHITSHGTFGKHTVHRAQLESKLLLWFLVWLWIWLMFCCLYWVWFWFCYLDRFVYGVCIGVCNDIFWCVHWLWYTFKFYGVYIGCDFDCNFDWCLWGS